MTAVFISYVREDERIVKFLTNILELNGISVWLDKSNLVPGQRWQAGIETAIQSGTYFLSIYSKARQARDVSYVHEETVVAVEEIRRRPITKPFFIPIKIDDCEIEPRPIGGGETILDLQICDLRAWSEGLKSLFLALSVDDPITDLGKPLADGIPSFVKISSGHITYDRIDSLPEIYQGMRFSVEAGWCTRNEDDLIIAYLEVVAPFTKFQAVNKMLGLSGMHAISHDEVISSDINIPSEFNFRRSITLPAGAPLLDFASGREILLPTRLTIDSDFSAIGVVDDLTFSGRFKAYLQFEGQTGRVNMVGSFDLQFEPDLMARPRLNYC